MFSLLHLSTFFHSLFHLHVTFQFQDVFLVESFNFSLFHFHMTFETISPKRIWFYPNYLILISLCFHRHYPTNLRSSFCACITPNVPMADSAAGYPANAQIPVDLFVSKKHPGLTRGDLGFADASGNIVFKVDRKSSKSSADKRVLLLDSEGNPLISMHRHHVSRCVCLVPYKIFPGNSCSIERKSF
jgi:hypothetical protein